MDEWSHPAIEALDRLQADLERAETRNRVLAECLALAVEALGRLGDLANEAFVLGVLAEIDRRLAKLEEGNDGRD